MNFKNQKLAIKAMIGGFALAMAAGCATSQQVEQAQADAAEARQAAEEARNMVQQVQSDVQEALEAARAAQSAADASQNCCTDLERKLDRALQDMQRK